MRLVAAVVIVMLAGCATTLEKYDVRDYFRQVVDKPSSAAKPLGSNSCEFARDNECDEPGIGTGLCAAGTDYDDCWRLAQGVEDDSCQYANDGECDEPTLGGGYCTQGTDATDCGPVAHLRFRNDTCATAFNGVCNEPGIGDGTCEARTDRSDCVGRERPLTIRDHFFGYDDRMLLDTSAFPWVVIGQLDFNVGGACTAALIAEDVLVTAAHCLVEDGVVDARGVFTTGAGRDGGPLQANVVAYFVDPLWKPELTPGVEKTNGLDWALVRIDRPLGAELGYLGVRIIDGPVDAIHQAGYSWDTGDALSGHLGCRVITVFDNSTLSHDCDTTRGDSGSPLMVRDGEQYFVIATDSIFMPDEEGPIPYVAVRSDGWVPYHADFASGVLQGTPAVRTKGGKSLD